MTDDGEIDRRLRAALRHAPDGDLAPPPSLDQAILAAARRAVAPPRRPWWDGLLRPLLAPTAAAALATVVVGGLVVVLWQGDAPPVPAPRDEAPADAAPWTLDARRERVAPGAPAAPSIGQPGAAGLALPEVAAARADGPAAAADHATAKVGAAKAARPAQRPAPSPGQVMRAGAERPSLAASNAAAAPPVADAGAPPATPDVPPVAELLRAASGPWERLPAERMPAGGTLLHDVSGQVIVGRVVVEGEVLWWQPWAGGQLAPQVLRAATSAADAQALQQRWPARPGLAPER